jgi:cell division protein FtsW (lipid II flippase)
MDDPRSLVTESSESRSQLTRAARRIERFLYVELALGLLLFVVQFNVMTSSAVECDIQNGSDTVGSVFAWTGIGLAVTGLVTYLARLSHPDRLKWFHLAFVLLLAVLAIALLSLFVQALGIGLSDSDYCS